jgi:bacterioferritin-associated ferredoxin
MIVCVCACVSDKEIQDEIQKGYSSLSDLQSRLNIAQVCGSCTPEIETIIQEAHNKKQPLNNLKFIKIE